MEKEKQFDYSEWSKSELDQLYHDIINTARNNPEYRRYVMKKWNIGIEEFWKRAMAVKMKDIRKEIKRKLCRDMVVKYFQDRHNNMTDLEADREWQHLKAVVAYKNPN